MEFYHPMHHKLLLSLFHFELASQIQKKNKKQNHSDAIYKTVQAIPKKVLSGKTFQMVVCINPPGLTVMESSRPHFSKSTLISLSWMSRVPEVDGSIVRISGLLHLLINGVFLGAKSPIDPSSCNWPNGVEILTGHNSPNHETGDNISAIRFREGN